MTRAEARRKGWKLVQGRVTDTWYVVPVAGTRRWSSIRGDTIAGALAHLALFLDGQLPGVVAEIAP